MNHFDEDEIEALKEEEMGKLDVEDWQPRIAEAKEQLRKGEISRREFIYIATLVGVPMAAAGAIMGANWDKIRGLFVTEDETIEPPDQPLERYPQIEAPDVPNESVPGSGITRGGTLTIGTPLLQLSDPALLFKAEESNVMRQIAEYLTYTDADNITHPWLLERWEANDDVSEWTLYLRQGVLFNNGDELTADDLLFNFSRWLNPENGSSMLGLLSYLRGDDSVEKIDDYTIKLYLTEGSIDLPAHLYHYPAAIMHRDFQGSFYRQPIGTGPFVLADFRNEEYIVLARRSDYWRDGVDGKPLPYLDNVVYFDVPADNSLDRLQEGKIDTITRPTPMDREQVMADDRFVIRQTHTTSSLILRSRTDLFPWDDPRVMRALRMCQDRQRILDQAWFGAGHVAIDAHIGRAHPAYPPDELIPTFDPVGARALLTEWAAANDYDLPLRATIVTKDDEGEAEYAQLLQETAALAGFELELDITSADGYWERWAEVPLGITSWPHRPLATMFMRLAYASDESGVTVPWNETRWVDQEFMALLRLAEKTLDVPTRRGYMAQIIDIFQERGPIGLPFFKDNWRINRVGIHNLPAHPSSYDILHETWLDG